MTKYTKLVALLPLIPLAGCMNMDNMNATQPMLNINYPPPTWSMLRETACRLLT